MSVIASQPLHIVLAMDEAARRDLLSPDLIERLHSIGEIDTDAAVVDFADPRHTARLATAEVLLTCWGVPTIDRNALARMPQLRAIVHGAGSIKEFVRPEVFDRGITVSSAAAANAIPVAEFTFAAIVFAAKHVGRFSHGYRENRSANARQFPIASVGAYGLTIGVVGASHIGRLLLERLRSLDVHVLLADPTVEPAEGEQLGAEIVALDDLLRRSDVVTLHAPSLPETRHLLQEPRLALLRDGATVINTARGALIDTDALTAELVSGRLNATLDVTDPEPLPPDSPLFELPNVLLTPHIAGALGNEIARLGEYAVTEIERLAADLPLAHAVRAIDLDRIA